MTTTRTTLTRFWVNQSQSAAIRLGDFTPAELRTIADEIESLCPPVQSQAEEATPPAGGWVYRLLWSKTMQQNVHCAVKGETVVPFLHKESSARYCADAFNDGTSSPTDYYKETMDRYEEAHV